VEESCTFQRWRGLHGDSVLSNQQCHSSEARTSVTFLESIHPTRRDQQFGSLGLSAWYTLEIMAVVALQASNSLEQSLSCIHDPASFRLWERPIVVLVQYSLCVQYSCGAEYLDMSQTSTGIRVGSSAGAFVKPILSRKTRLREGRRMQGRSERVLAHLM
jgi:hypothetical protein